MQLLLNSDALVNVSRGVKRYGEELHSIFRSEINATQTEPSRIMGISRVHGFLAAPGASQFLWTPTPMGSVLKCRQVITVHDMITDLMCYRNYITRFSQRKLIKRIVDSSSGVAFISESAKDQFIDIFGSCGTPNAVILSGFPKLDEGNGNSPDNLNDMKYLDNFILSVGNDLRHKNIDFLVEGYLRSEAISRGIKLVLVGVEKTYKNRNIIELTNLSDHHLAQLRKQALVYVSPSIIEGHNLTVAEALSNGAHCLISDIAAHREFYNEYCSFFNVTSSDSLVSQLNEHVLLRKKRFANTASRPIRSMRDTASDYIDFFRDLRLL